MRRPHCRAALLFLPMRYLTFPVGPLACNCSIIAEESSNQAVIVDPGENVDAILRLLDQRGWKLKAIVITHAHIDHIGGAAALKKVTGAPVLMNSRDQFLYDALDAQASWLGVAVPPRTSVDGGLDEGSALHLLSTPIQVIETPGHTPGSICLYLPQEQRLFAGDTLFAGSIGRTDLPGGDTAQILRSLHEKILPLPDDTLVIPGHGAETTIGAERVSNPFVGELGR